MSPVILVVDDEPAIRDILSAILMDEHYEVLTAANGREALGRLRQAAADVILSDVMMPVLDGYGLVAALRAGGDRTPVILMSAAPITPDAGDGAVRIDKPFDLDAMLTTIASTLHES